MKRFFAVLLVFLCIIMTGCAAPAEEASAVRLIALNVDKADCLLLLLEDSFGHFLYPTKDVAASVLGVQNIVTVPPMADVATIRTDEDTGKSYRPLMIICNLKDYNIGADKGGSVNMFEDFDIDYNAQKYLIETRCSGALVRPFSAIVIEEEVEEESGSGDDNT